MQLLRPFLASLSPAGGRAQAQPCLAHGRDQPGGHSGAGCSARSTGGTECSGGRGTWVALSALAAEVLSGWAHQTGGSSPLSSLRAATPPLQTSNTSHRLPDAEQRAASAEPCAELNITSLLVPSTLAALCTQGSRGLQTEFVISELKTSASCLSKRERIEGLAGKLYSANSSFPCLLDATAMTALFTRCPSVTATNQAKGETRTFCGGMQL